MNVIELAILVVICAGVLVASLTALAIAPRGYRAAAGATVLLVGFGWIIGEANIGELVLAKKCRPATIVRTVHVLTFLERSSDGYCYSCDLSVLSAGYSAIEFYVNDVSSPTGREFGADEPGYYRFQLGSPQSSNCLRRYRTLTIDGHARCIAAEKIDAPISAYEAVHSTSEARTSLGKLRRREHMIRRIADGEMLAHFEHYHFFSETFLGRLLSDPGNPGTFGGAFCRTSFGGPTIVLQPPKL